MGLAALSEHEMVCWRLCWLSRPIVLVFGVDCVPVLLSAVSSVDMCNVLGWQCSVLVDASPLWRFRIWFSLVISFIYVLDGCFW